MSDDVLTMDKLKEVMALAPQPVGYALLVPSSLNMPECYKIFRNTGGASDFMPGKSLYWLIVPRSMLQLAIDSLHAYPSDDIPGEAYRFNVFKDDSL